MDIKSVIEMAGGAPAVAQAIGRHRTSVLGWTRVPAEHVRVVAGLCGLSRHTLRPDLYEEQDGASVGTSRNTHAAA